MKKVYPVQKHVVEEVKVGFSDRDPEIKRIGRDLDGNNIVKAEIRIDGEAVGFVRTGELQQLNVSSVYVSDYGFAKIYGSYHGISYEIDIKTEDYANLKPTS